MNSITRIAGKGLLIAKKYSPEILLVVGLGSGITAGVMAVKASKNSDEIKEDHMDRIENIHEMIEDDANGNIVYSKSQQRKDIFEAYMTTGVKYCKLYGPSITMAGISIASILASHGLMQKRYFGMATAFAALSNEYKEYQKRVIADVGEDKHLFYKYGFQEKEEISSTVDENGVTNITSKQVYSVDPNQWSIYAKFFDESNPNWVNDASMNRAFIQMIQNQCNDKLRAQGYLFLNDVYQALGMERTVIGQCVGWFYDAKNPIGDNYVDFGIFNTNQKNRDFVNGFEKSILLDFNVDGNILDMPEIWPRLGVSTT
jgi:hypothetical protein